MNYPYARIRCSATSYVSPIEVGDLVLYQYLSCYAARSNNLILLFLVVRASCPQELYKLNAQQLTIRSPNSYIN